VVVRTAEEGFAATYRIGCDMSQRMTFIRHDVARLMTATLP